MVAIENYFQEKGDEYSKYRPTYPKQLGESLAELCQNTNHVLEVGCGTGQLSGVLAQYFDTVTATDPSEEQINNATAFARVNYQHGTAEKIELPANSVDLIVAAQAAHWFDLPKFYEQALKVAKPNALLALISYGVMSIEGDIHERFDAFYWQEVHQFWPPERIHVEQGYQAFDFPFDELSMPNLSIKRQWTNAELLGYIETWSAVRLARKQGHGKIIDTFIRDIELINPDKTTRHQIEWPINGRIGKL